MALEIKIHKKIPENPSENLVILVHGLFSSSTTWSSEGKQWVTFLQEDPELSDVDIATIEYRTHLNHTHKFRLVKSFLSKNKESVLKSGNPTPIAQLAKDLKVQLDSQLLAPYQRIILIGHSMGGLVSIRYLLDEFINEKPTKIVGFASLATPYGGAKLANLHKLPQFVYQQSQITALKPGSKFLTELNAQWLVLHKKMDHILFKFFHGEDDWLVKTEDAFPSFFSDRATCLPGDHNQILYIYDHKASTYLLIKDHILTSFAQGQKITTSVPIVPATPSSSLHQLYTEKTTRLENPSIIPEDYSSTAWLLRKKELFSSFKPYMASFISRFHPNVQENVSQAIDAVQDILVSLDSQKIDEILKCYRFPFDYKYREDEGLRHLWEVMTLLHIAYPDWTFNTSNEIANVRLQSTIWKRLIHSAHQQTMPEIIFPIARKILDGPYATDIFNGKIPLFRHRLLLDNILVVQNKSLCLHCQDPTQPPIPFRLIQRDFTGGMDIEIFEGVEPNSNTYKDLENVEMNICCSSCLFSRAFTAQSFDDLQQSIKEVIQ